MERKETGKERDSVINIFYLHLNIDSPFYILTDLKSKVYCISSVVHFNRVTSLY